MSAFEAAGMSRSDADRNRRALLDAAARALAYDPGASMADVAAAAGLARATLYRHFRTRQELLAALRAEALVRAGEAITASRPDEGPPLEGLRRAVEALAPLGVRFRALLLDGADIDPAFLRERDRVLAPLRRVVRRGQKAGVIRADVPPEWVVTALASLLIAAVRTWPDGTAGDRSVAELVYRTLTRGLATPVGAG
ncbi:MAG TPA: TetR family transcriptional regulator [Jiangellales bacterium]|nr:TetR family transcriptional regulator [Jiangellales bacterium]